MVCRDLTLLLEEVSVVRGLSLPKLGGRTILVGAGGCTFTSPFHRESTLTNQSNSPPKSAYAIVCKTQV